MNYAKKQKLFFSLRKNSPTLDLSSHHQNRLILYSKCSVVSLELFDDILVQLWMVPYLWPCNPHKYVIKDLKLKYFHTFDNFFYSQMTRYHTRKMYSHYM